MSENASDAQEAQIIEGGEIVGVGDSRIRIDPLKRERARTTRMLAYVLIAVLAFSLLIHYIVVFIMLLRGEGENVDILNQIYSNWLPVISGLASSAVTYYFTKEK
jgi:hypothetical protein